MDLGLAEPPGERACSSGVRCWSGKNSTRCSSSAACDGRELGVGERAEVHAADLGAERAGDGVDLEGDGSGGGHTRGAFRDGSHRRGERTGDGVDEGGDHAVVVAGFQGRFERSVHGDETEPGRGGLAIGERLHDEHADEVQPEVAHRLRELRERPGERVVERRELRREPAPSIARDSGPPPWSVASTTA